MSGSEKLLKYRSDIDGLRALAVIPVILFHFDIAGFQGGFVGVDIFFVISGYLITALIYKEISNGSFSFWDFYERRARRLLPAAFLVIFCCCIAGWFLFTPEDFKEFGKSLRAVSLVVSNVFFMLETGYFDLPSQVKPLLHTWSLAVEEQFYIVFPPLLLLLMWKFTKYISAFLISLFFVSLGISIATVEYFPAFAFYMLPSRAWELLLGSMLAVGLFPIVRSRLLNNILGLSGFAMIVIAIALYDEKISFPSLAALLPCVGAVFIIWSSMSEKSWAGAVLSWRPFIFVGLISYSLYLWHWPLRVFSQYYVGRELFASEKVVLIVLTFFLSYLTWKFIEQPVRKKKIFLMPKQVLKYTVVGGAAFLIFGQVLDRLKGVPIRLPEPARSYAMSVWEKNPDRSKCHSLPAEMIAQKKLCILGIEREGDPDFIVWGDSHADMIMPVLKKLAKDKKLYGWFASYSGCAPILKSNHGKQKRGCYEFNKAMLKVVRNTKVKDIMLVAFWWPKVRDAHKLGEENIKSIELANTLEKLGEKNVWIFTDVPIQKQNIPAELVRRVLSGEDIYEIGLPTTTHMEQQNQIKDFFSQAAKRKLNFIDSYEQLCAGRDRCTIAANGKSLYRDTHHLTNSGAFYISGAFEPMFDSIKSERN